MAEPVVSLGATFPLVPFFPKDAVDARLKKVTESRCVIVKPWCVGREQPRTGLFGMELVEHLSKIALMLDNWGSEPLDPAVVEALSKKGRPSSAERGKKEQKSARRRIQFIC